MARPQYWQSALLYLYRPNLINRRYIGAQIISSFDCQESLPVSEVQVKEVWLQTSLTQLQTRFKLIQRNGSIESHDLSSSVYPIFLLRKLFRKQSLKSLQENANSEHSFNDHEFDLVILFPSINLFVLITINYDEALGNICLNLENTLSYSLGLAENSEDKLDIGYLFGVSSNYWLENIMKPKLEQWMLSTLDSKNCNTFQGSIKMISVENYCMNYNRMKAKYSLALLDIWSKVEKTDPIKFIFEDIAIAAYLVTMWQEEYAKLKLQKLQTFLDVGCGNGLLVHILANEGYTGYGVDVRKRNIWDHFGSSVNLIEMQIDPMDDQNLSKLPKCDWLIGNHSDELTPWIIYMASCSSPTRAFILPCCCYDFDGFKFQRTTEPNKSQYQCYIDFLEGLCDQFGFKSFRDKLRIPSTKRICLVCYDRNYDNFLTTTSTELQEQHFELLEEKMKQKRSSIVRERLQIRASLRLREKEETVRNCTRMDPQIKDKIICCLTSQLVSGQFVSGLTFKEAIHLLDNEMRDQMKKQCGGLQTFIRNHKHIFTICNYRITFQSVDQLRVKSNRPKTKECWFFRHHPQGCKLKDSECAYKH